MLQTLFYGLAVVGAASQVLGKATINLEIQKLQDSNASVLNYPTQLTQNIMPKAIHSHNDYWRDTPLFEAISFGVASVEADVWAINGTLYLGHEMAALTKARTFESAYINPLMQMLAMQNPKNEFTVNQTRPNGVFDTSSGTPLQLLVDMKTDGTLTLPLVLKAIKPLKDAGYLTTFVNGTIVTGPVTVVGTGNTPLIGIQTLSPRYMFFDAPLTQLKNATMNKELNVTWGPELAPVASTDYNAAIGWSGIGDISKTQLAAIRQFVADSDSLGIKSRFWDTPETPQFAMVNVWQTLLVNGAFWLNADDLAKASSF